MRSAYDVLFLPDPTPVGFDIAAGYLASPGIHSPWPVSDWQRATTTAKSLLPIVGCWPPFGQPTADVANEMVAWLGVAGALGWKIGPGSAIMLDVEEEIANDAVLYVTGWRTQVRNYGYTDVVYCSGSTAHLFNGGPVWPAEWNNVPHLADGPNVVGTQWASPTSDPQLQVDVSQVVDSLVVWTQSPAPKGHEMFQLVQIVDAPTVGQKAAVWWIGGAQRSWVQTPQTRDMLILFAAQQGLPTEIGSVTMAQISGIPVVGPMPS